MAAPTAAIIRAEPNAELRRLLLEHFTYERFVAESGATPVQDDEAGKLWRIIAANELTIRSGPTSGGLAVATTTPVLMPIPAITGGRSGA